MRPPNVLTAVAVLIGVAAVPGQATQEARSDKGIPPCPPGRVENYLAARAQQCWYEATHGRWRTLSHNLHYYTIVAQAEAASLEDAEEIARRFVEVHSDRFQEVLLYVQEESAPETSLIRRIQWTRPTGYERLEFVGSLRR